MYTVGRAVPGLGCFIFFVFMVISRSPVDGVFRVYAGPTPRDPKTVSSQECDRYSDCDLVVLKARGIVRDHLGNPLDNASVRAVEINRSNVDVVEFYRHCGNRLHEVAQDTMSFSASDSSAEPGFYELVFVVCTEESIFPDFDVDFEITVSAPGFLNGTATATFDEGDDRDEIDFMLDPAPKETGNNSDGGPLSLHHFQNLNEKGFSGCWDFSGCTLFLLDVDGVVMDASGNGVSNATVTATINRLRDVKSVEFYQHCGDGEHRVLHGLQGVSGANLLAQPGQFELIMVVCADEALDFAVDFDLCVSAPGFQDSCLVVTFDESDLEDDRDFFLEPVAAATPTPTLGQPTQAPTAIDPEADVDGDGVINADDLLLILKNWLRIVP